MNWGLKARSLCIRPCCGNDGSQEWNKSFDSNAAYVADQVALHKEAVAHGVRVLNYPGAVRLFCAASKPSSWTISSNGDLHKCWDTINDHKSAVGNVNGLIIDEGAHNQWLEWSPFNHEKCRRCNVMPLCMAGCAHHAFDKGGEPQCESWKFGLRDAILAWVEDSTQNATLGASQEIGC